MSKPQQSPGSQSSPKKAPVSAPLPFDPKQIREVKTWKHNRTLTLCRFDPAGRFVFAAAYDNLVQRWDLATNQKTELPGHKTWVGAMAFQPQGGLLFTGDYAGRVLCWSYADKNPKPVWSIEAHRGWVRSVSVSPDGRLIASAGHDNIVRLWSTTEGKLVRELTGHTSHIYSTAFHSDGRHLVSGDFDGVVKQWQVSTGKPIRDFDAKLLCSSRDMYPDASSELNFGGVNSMAFSKDGTLLTCVGFFMYAPKGGDFEPMGLTFDWSTGKQKWRLQTEKSPKGQTKFLRVVYHPANFPIAVVNGSTSGLWFWKPSQPISSFTLELPQPKACRDVDVHPDGLQLAVARYDGTLAIYDISSKSKPKKN